MGPSAEQHNVASGQRYLSGSVTVGRVNLFKFPAFEMTKGTDIILEIGRLSSWSIYFGSGQRIELHDGKRWRISSIERSGAISAVVVDDEKRLIAMGSLTRGGYGINGKGFAYDLVSLEKSRPLTRSNRWILRESEEELAEITRVPSTLVAHHPVRVSALVLAHTLAHVGIPGEKGMPSPRWANP